MITNPSTLGLFEEHIAEIAEVVHAAGGLVYMDGANFNALLGKVRPGDVGVDVMHFNLHKTFTTPHGGGGPGSGPGRRVGAALEPFLPTPTVEKRRATRYALDYDRPKSIGRLRSFYGNFGMFVRAYTYIREMGGAGLTQATEMAVLNANYLRARLKDVYPLRLRQAVDARGGVLRQAAQEGDRRPDARRRQAADRLRLPPADDLLPAGRCPARS